MKQLPIFVLSLIIAAFLFFASSSFIVTEGQRAIVLRFGQMEKNPQQQVEVFTPGIHFKIPFIEQVQYFDVRLQTLDISSSRIMTSEQKDVIVDYYVKWRIQNVPLFFTSTGNNEDVATTLLQQQVNDNLRAQFGLRTIVDVVKDARSQIVNVLQQQANQAAQNFGINVYDVRIKRIDLPDNVSTAVFSRMNAKRVQIATEFRSKGQANAMVIRANADAQAALIVAAAQAKAAGIKANAQAKAAKIYADAFGKDPNFYAFYRSLTVYQRVFNSKNDFIVLKPNSEFMKYFNSSSGSAELNSNKQKS